jgi:hypothetical protein
MTGPAGQPRRRVLRAITGKSTQGWQTGDLFPCNSGGGTLAHQFAVGSKTAGAEVTQLHESADACFLLI